MPPSPFTFAGAIRLLDPDRAATTLLDNLLGGALFATAGATLAGPIGGLSALGILSLVDPKNEATKLLTPLVTKTVARLRKTADRTNPELIAAAHTITVLSSYFDALKDELGSSYEALKITEKEKRRLAGGGPESADLISDLTTFEVPLPSPAQGFVENLEQNLRPYFRRLTNRCYDFIAGLEAWAAFAGHQSLPLPAVVVLRAEENYRDRMLQIGPLQPFALWISLNEHAATRAAVEESTRSSAAALGDLRTLLSIVAAATPAPGNGLRAQLAAIAQEVLDEPLLRSGLRTVVSPKVRDGFVKPAFHLARSDGDSRPADEAWWARQPRHESLVDYLATYLADDASTRRPLLLLGHPGAGKSLLTEVLAAQLPAESFAVVRIPLRHVNTDDDLPVQINKELQRTLQKPGADFDQLRAECGEHCRLVIVLDGFDELVQATGVTQSGYLNKLVEFQKRALTLGAPTAVVVTSRTVVAEHAEIPEETPMIRLCEFDDGRIGKWVAAWNKLHSKVDGYQSLDAKALVRDRGTAELARQPLLLLVLAVYLAELGTNLLGQDNLTQARLYQRILDHFIRRQVTEKTASGQQADPTAEAIQRKNLQFAALGMFNRGRQHLTDDELDADLAALAPAPDQPTGTQPLRQAHRVLGEFMFVHNAKADQEQRNAYEFLHATFGEYLVAEFTYQQLTRLAALRKLEQEQPVSYAGPLDDSLLRRLLSYQPLSSRRPVIDFIRELAEDEVELLATLSTLLQASLTRPDLAPDSYRPLPYDPLRHRASYAANLTLLRVQLDPQPVPVTTLVGDADRWAPTVRLWRAGLDDSAWSSVVGSLRAPQWAFVPGDSPLVIHRTEGARTSVTIEQELIGDRSAMAAVVGGYTRAYLGDRGWTDQELGTFDHVAQLRDTRLSTSHLGQLLPYDLNLYKELLASFRNTPTTNPVLRESIVSLLATDAPHLPLELISDLLRCVFSASGLGSHPELSAIVSAHPVLLRTIPGLSDLLSRSDWEYSTVIGLLWSAEQIAQPADRSLLRELRKAVDQDAAARFDPIAPHRFDPRFVSYLREERPIYWMERDAVLTLFGAIEPGMLAYISPDDALFAAENWPDGNEEFILNYLSGREHGVAAEIDPLTALRMYVRRPAPTTSFDVSRESGN